MLGDVTSVVRNVRRRTKVVTMIEEGFLFRSIVRNITVTWLRVIRVARIIPAYRWTRVSIRCGVGLRSLNPTLWHVVVAEFCEDGIISNTRVLWITVRTLFCRYTWCNALLLIVCLFLLLNLSHTLSIILLTSRYV